MIYKYIVNSLVALLFLSSAIFSANALMVTDVGTSARMLGMGQIEGFDTSAISIFENPAVLYRIENQSVAVYSTKLMSEVDYRNFAYAKKTKFGTFAVGYMSAAVSGIPETVTANIDNGFVVSGHFNVDNFVVKTGMQTSLSDSVSVGAALDYYSNTIQSVKGTGYNMDVGVVYRRDMLELSGSIKNILTQSKSNFNNGGEETYPLQSVMSLKYEWYSFDLMSQAKTSSAHDYVLKSAGLSYKPSFMPVITFHSGIKEFLNLDSTKNHYTFGISLLFNGLGFDYAYEKSEHVQFDNNSYFSMKFLF